MAFSGAIEIMHSGQGELKLIFPPSHAGALLLVGLTVLFLLLTLAMSRRRVVSVFMLLIALASCFMALSEWSYRGAADLSVADRTLTVTEHSNFFDHTRTYPLNAVESAVVQNGRYQNRRFAFMLGSGQLVPVGEYRGGGGFYQAAEAVNTFLKSGRAQVK